ncbi:WbqC family protein [Rubritalea tangerina]
MQPYFLPYIGYFQLIQAVDVFVVYDDIEFTKRGWIHRNRLLLNEKVSPFSINLEKASDYLMVRDRKISEEFSKTRKKLLSKIEQSYKKAPYFDETYPLVKECFLSDCRNLFDFIFHSIVTMCSHLNIETKIVISSHLKTEGELLRHKYRVWDLCSKVDCDSYINSEGGRKLYDKSEFEKQGMCLSFLQTTLEAYPQFGGGEFEPALSIVDILMMKGREAVIRDLNKYFLD